LYGGDNVSDYSVHIKNRGESAWYLESQLTLIESNRIDLLLKWEDERNEEIKIKSDLDWIFSHGNDVIKNPHGCSLQALANCFGLMDLWGSRGEGFVYQANASRTLQFAAPFLLKGDKDGWMSFAESLKQSLTR
jgi:hypothetical protein